MQGSFFCCLTMFLLLTSKFLDLSLDPSIFLIYESNIFLGYIRLNFSPDFEDIMPYEIPEDFFHLKYDFYMHRSSL